ncbi:AMP-binding protein [Sinorhizobium meliloti]|uniref:AMP-binding protein n=1 Tax=Rhizobium meliloti TaxID=382 RepID=UPI001F431E31|nr:AMP-binding protein [Sinorhizobium meliloti]
MESPTVHSLIPILSGPRRPLRFGHDKIASVIAETLDKFPSNTAVRTCEGGDVSYRELGRSASHLMGRLEAIGVRPGDAVIVKLPRSIDLVTIILATQMLGVAFVPVDPSESDQRLHQILRNTSPHAIVSQEPDGSLRFERLTTRAGINSAFPDIAYIMHTSGSTGIPKAVPVSQPALLNFVDWYIDVIDFSADASIAQLSRPSFDFSIPEFFVPFLTGGKIVLPSTQFQTQIIPTIEFLIQSNANVIQLVPTLLRRFLGTLERLPSIAERLTNLKYVVSNGEPLPDAMRRRFYSLLPHATLINSYGPTECCVAVSYHYCRRVDAKLPMYIGKPARNMDFFVLDESQSSVGLGVEGELWVGGVQTSQRYVANEIQSKLRFVRNMTATGEQTLYRTGDYVVATEEQGLRFLGRKDDQIKFRGLRLEKGEITSAIDRTRLCTGSAVVVVDRDDDTGQELVCMVTPESVDVDEVHRRLSGALPNDRAPRLVLSLEELPSNANGKLDQSALEGIAKEALRAKAQTPTHQTIKATESSLDCLLKTVHAVTGRQVLPYLTARECGIDSLNFLEIQLKLAETGLMFGKDVFQEQDLRIEDWSRRLQPVDHPGSQAGTTSKCGRADQLRDELVQIVEYVETRDPSMIVLHSSLVALRDVPAADVASLLIEAIQRISARTTVLLPAFTLSYCSTQRYHWTETKSETGVLADLVMQKLPSARTKHPAYSMVATGPRSHELGERDWWKCSPFGDDSIFGEVSRSNGLIIGLGTSNFTHVHRCELLAHVPYRKTINFRGRADFGRGAIDVSTAVYIRDVKGQPEYSFLAHDTSRDVSEMRDVLREFAIAGTYARLVDARDMESKLVPVMESEPYGFLDEDARAEARNAYPVKHWVE